MTEENTGGMDLAVTKRPDKFAACLIEIGEELLISGAEVSRVEDTLIRMGNAYGVREMNVFVITSCIIITMVMPEEREITQTRRITRTVSTDFFKVERLNDLSRRYCSCPFAEEQLAEELQAMGQEREASRRVYVGSMLAAASFAMFFGGTPADGAAAAAGAVLICLLQNFLSEISPNRMIYQMLCSGITGAAIGGMGRLLPFLLPDKIMIGDIMLLIPGIAMTNSVRDILVGDTISGIMRLIETILWAGALAAGFMISMHMMRG